MQTSSYDKAQHATTFANLIIAHLEGDYSERDRILMEEMTIADGMLLKSELYDLLNCLVWQTDGLSPVPPEQNKPR